MTRHRRRRNRAPRRRLPRWYRSVRGQYDALVELKHATGLSRDEHVMMERLGRRLDARDVADYKRLIRCPKRLEKLALWRRGGG